MKRIKKLAFIVNRVKSGAEALYQELETEAHNQGVQCKVTTEQVIPEGFLKGQDACCVIGGDGTLLTSVHESIKEQVPVFGINQGKLGFLATFSVDQAKSQFVTILEGQYHIQNRCILKCKTYKNQESYALNDVVIKHTVPSRLMDLEVFCNEEFITSYSCDGLIMTTPTGSTAYNLSAGGPIIHPGANVFAMTPICPHTLSNRTVIFDRGSVIKVDLPEQESSDITPHAIISLDGQVPWKEYNPFPISITIAEQTLALLQPYNYSHFRILRNKLKWGD